MTGYPSEAELRRAIINRAREYTEATGLAISTVSKHALNDSRFLEKVRDGGNFSIRNYTRVMDFFDSNMPAWEGAPRPPAPKRPPPKKRRKQRRNGRRR
jgi:hypothetical protein